ncbi:MAG: transcription-repair coupling factor, partial [Pontibacterium sp.]
MFNLVPEKVTGAGDIKRTGCAIGSAKALAIACAAQQHSSLTLVITNDSDEATRLTAELEFFLGNKLPVYNLPDWETLPYDVFSPHQDIISERIAALYALPGLDKGVLVVPVSTLMHRLTPKSFIVDQGLRLNTDERLDIEAFKAQLVDTGYQVV